MSKIFTVFGATGQQGGALIRYLLQHPIFSSTYRLRGVTRDASKAAAIALRQQGVDIIEADLNKPETLKTAVEGSYAVFSVTNWKSLAVLIASSDWETARAADEIAQGKAVADAAVEAGVKLFIWSSLPRVGMPHFDSKAEVEQYIRSLPLTSVFFMAGGYMQNFLTVMRPVKRADGTYALRVPFPGVSSSTLLPLIDIEDTGKYIAPVLHDPPKYNHANLYAATAFYSIAEICEIWTKCTGVQVVFESDGGVSRSNPPEAEKVASDKVDGAKDLSYFGPGGQKGIEWTLAQVQEHLTTWEEFVKSHEPWFA